MRNFVQVFSYSVMAAITLTTIVLSLRARKGRSLAGIFLFYSSMTFCWQLTSILAYSVKSPGFIRFFNTAMLPFVAFVALSAIIFVLRFYGMERYYSNAILPGLCICPAITSVLAFFFFNREYLTVGFTLQSVAPKLVVAQSHAPWFWVHAVYCYVLIMVAFAISFIRHRGLPKKQKSISIILLAGMIISVFFSFLNVSGILKAPIDLALVGVTFCGIFMYFASLNNHGLEYVYTARRGIFNSLGDAAVIMDSERSIISANRAAHELFVKMGLDPDIKSFASVTGLIERRALIPSEEEGRGIDFLLNGEFFNLRERVISGRDNKLIGYFAVIKNVNQNRRIIRRLEEEAGMDALTGLYNRMKMDKMRDMLDHEDNYPLGVIYGDMNGLKEVNDSLGHQQGDVLLMAGAEALVSSCPPSACVGRTGGDEFLVLLPGYSEERASALIAEITARMSREDEYPYEVSMSLGAAAKTDASQSLDEIINIADARMYEDKCLYKASRGLHPPRRTPPPISGIKGLF